MRHIIDFLIRSNCLDPITSFQRVTFSTYRRACLKFSGQSPLKRYIRRKQSPSFLKRELNTFLAACANSLEDSFPYMFTITSLVVLCMRKLILNHLIKNFCLEFPNGLRDSYFFKLTLGRAFWNFTSEQLLSNPFTLSITRKKPVAYKPELLTQFYAYALSVGFKMKPLRESFFQ